MCSPLRARGVFNTRAREKELETSSIVIVDWCYARRKLNSHARHCCAKERERERERICVHGSNRFRNHTCRTDVIFGYFGGLLSSPSFFDFARCVYDIVCED